MFMRWPLWTDPLAWGGLAVGCRRCRVGCADARSQRLECRVRRRRQPGGLGVCRVIRWWGHPRIRTASADIGRGRVRRRWGDSPEWPRYVSDGRVPSACPSETAPKGTTGHSRGEPPVARRSPSYRSSQRDRLVRLCKAGVGRCAWAIVAAYGLERVVATSQLRSCCSAGRGAQRV